MVSVTYKNVSIAYDDFVVVENLSLDIFDGEITTLLGPSGCGKTTLLRAIAGFVEPYEGAVFLGNRDITLLPPQKRNTAMIFQNYALWPHLTIFENVEYGLKIRKSQEQLSQEKPWFSYLLWLTNFFYFWPKKIVTRKKVNQYRKFKAKFDKQFEYRQDRVIEALKLVHLEDQADKLPTELSGGQQQRIALARSIVVQPDILLCDEPLSNLDAKLRKELRTEIRSIIKNIGMTAVYVTHDQAEALAISDRIAVLNEGKIEQYGTPTEVFQDPKTLFVGQFIGSSSTLSGKAISSDTVKIRGGEIVKVVTKQPLEIDSEVDLVIRPEVVSLVKETKSPIEFEINTIEYLGNEVKLTGKLKDETILLVDVAEQTEQYAKMKVGDKIKAYIAPEEVLVFVDKKRAY